MDGGRKGGRYQNKGERERMTKNEKGKKTKLSKNYAHTNRACHGWNGYRCIGSSVTGSIFMLRFRLLLGQ